MPDSAKYGDAGSNTLAAIAAAKEFDTPNLQKLGLFNIEGVNCYEKTANPAASFARMREKSDGKDTTIGHWEIAGIISPKPLPVFPEGFPSEVIEKFEKATGRKTLCNKPYSGTQVLLDYGKEHVETGALIVYTSADSVFQVAAHEEVVPVPELYRYCDIAREIMQGDYGVGRIIARPFIGTYPDYKRTANRHDVSLPPPSETMLDLLAKAGKDTIAIGKIYDIFDGKGVSEKQKTKDNVDGMEKTMAVADKDFNGLCFVNLVDFDMVYGHRNNVPGYANAATVFDRQLGEFMKLLKKDDVVIITADHGCDPATPSTDHSREHTPMIIFGDPIKSGVDLKTRDTFADIAATILDYLEVPSTVAGSSFLNDVLK